MYYNSLVVAKYLYKSAPDSFRRGLRFYTPLISFFSKNKNTHHSNDSNDSHTTDETLLSHLFPPTKLSQQQIDTINNGFYQEGKILYTGKNTILKGKLSDADKSAKKKAGGKDNKK